MKNIIFGGILLISLIGFSSCKENNGSSGHFNFTMPGQASIHQKVDSLLHQLTLKEKLSLLGGTGFTTKPIPRLGIPALKMVDGPVGVRADEIKNSLIGRLPLSPAVQPSLPVGIQASCIKRA